MRLILTVRDRDVLDVEVLLWRRRPQQGTAHAPTMHATGGGDFERGGSWGDPATIGQFGFHSTTGDRR